MIRVTLDTNVLAPGIISSSESVHGQIIQAWRGNQYSLVLSEPILTELSRTFTQPYFASRLTTEQIAGTLSLLRSQASIVPLTVPVSGVATHPEDDLILATAVNGKADYLVTRDEKLQAKIPEYQDVSIVSPVIFLQRLREDLSKAA